MQQCLRGDIVFSHNMRDRCLLYDVQTGLTTVVTNTILEMRIQRSYIFDRSRIVSYMSTALKIFNVLTFDGFGL